MTLVQEILKNIENATIKHVYVGFVVLETIVPIHVAVYLIGVQNLIKILRRL